jgi:hypothetical protein
MTKNALVFSLVGALSATVLASQAKDRPLVRFGKVGEALTGAEIAEISELAISTGRRPWILLGQSSMELGRQSVSLFLEPDVIGGRVLRGGMLRLGTEAPPVVPVRSGWRIQESRRYAYVPANGRRPEDISSESDTDWPFIVEGEFDDDTLISIVEFIRSKPPVPMPAFRKEVAAAPIVAVVRREDAIIVGQRTSEATGDAIWLARKNGQWIITRFQSSIA